MVMNGKTMPERLRLQGILYGVLKGTVEARMALQPVVHLRSREIVGYEALFRVPEWPGLVVPDLWTLAQEDGVLEDLEDVVRELCEALPVRSASSLFVNAHPAAHGTVERWRNVSRVVIEIGEKETAPDGLLLELNGAGIPFALDDIGVGVHNFVALVGPRPEYLKIDRSLIHNVHREVARQHMVEALVGYAGRIGTRVIAEGIEVKEEARTLLRLGVPLGQGYWLGRPTFFRP